MKTIELFDREMSDFFMEIDSPSTISFFKGEAPMDFLNKRIHTILTMNPWLNGRLVKKNGRVSIEYQKTLQLTKPIFRVVQEKDFVYKRKVNEYDHLLPLCVKPAYDILNKDEPFFTVVVVERSETEFFIVVSLNHVVGDGHSFYSIYKMLSKDVTPYSLIIERNFEAHDDMMKRIKDEEDLIFSLGITGNLIYSAMTRKKFKIRTNLLNTDYIQKVKEEYNSTKGKQHQSSIDFISTNDIITSDFYKVSNSTLGVMAVNFRNRLSGLSDEFVGNYEGGSANVIEKDIQPESIRKELNKICDLSDNKTIYPGFLRRLRARIGFITNWSGFYHELVFDGCEFVFHEPIIDAPSSPTEAMIVYKKNKNEIALMTLETKLPIMKRLEEKGLVIPESC